MFIRHKQEQELLLREFCLYFSLLCVGLLLLISLYFASFSLEQLLNNNGDNEYYDENS